jgi:hypothetical protein
MVAFWFPKKGPSALEKVCAEKLIICTADKAEEKLKSIKTKTIQRRLELITKVWHASG